MLQSHPLFLTLALRSGGARNGPGGRRVSVLGFTVSRMRRFLRGSVYGRSDAGGLDESDRPLWLDVPFAEKDEAKRLGARWDQAARRWYAPRPGMAGLDRWAPRPPLPELLPGEDRSFGSGLFVDLVPQSCWFTSARTGIAPVDWERTRRMVYERAGNRCEACKRAANPAAGVRMEAHERWFFDDAQGVQVLRRLICLCGACHGATHWGLAQIQGRSSEALNHLMMVRGFSLERAAVHIGEATEVWRERSARTWDLDLSILTGAGVELAREVSPARREEIARERLAAERGHGDDELGRWIANDDRLQRMSASAVEDDEDDFDDGPDPRDVGSNDSACSVTITPGWDVERYLRNRRR